MMDKLTPKDFAPHLLAVLGRLTEYRPDKDVEMTQVFGPVLREMGLEEECLGMSSNGTTLQTHRQIGLAMRQMRDHGLTTYAKRGFWALTPGGIKEALSDAGKTPPTDEELAAARSEATEQTEAGEPGERPAETGTLLQLSPRASHPYSEDPYVRAVAAQQTPCFGAHSPRSDTCGGCPLAAECLRAVEARKAELAAQLDADEIRARQEARERAEREAQKDATVDELIAHHQTSVSSTLGGKKGRYKPEANQDTAPAHAQRQSTCRQCGEVIPEDLPCTWVQDLGMFHNECVEQN